MSDAKDDDQQYEDDNRSQTSTATNDQREFDEAVTKFSKALETMTATKREMTTAFMSGVNLLSDLIRRNRTNSWNRDNVPETRNETSVNRSEIIELIRNELEKAGNRSNNNTNQNRNPATSVAQELSQKIRVELVGKDSGK